MNVAADSRHIVSLIVTDNYFFGGASVSGDGNESPVIFQGPAGSFGD